MSPSTYMCSARMHVPMGAAGDCTNAERDILQALSRIDSVDLRFLAATDIADRKGKMREVLVLELKRRGESP